MRLNHDWQPPAHLIVVECTADEMHLLPEPLHVLDYQTGTLRLELPRNQATIVALRLCGVRVPE